MAIVTLLSDFGTRDGYVGAMKGVILARAPGALLCDVTHDIAPQDVWGGAWALREAARWFPPGTIHLAVVDPGVGTSRRPLVLQAAGQLFVGPDNGLLTLAGAEGATAWVLDDPTLFCQPVSATFQGRDIFASVAGHLACGREATTCGTPTDHWERLSERPALCVGDKLHGEVAYVDRFGNLLTNMPQRLIAAAGAGWGEAATGWEVWLEQRHVGRLRQTYADVAPGHWVAYIGSGGQVEIALRDGTAAGAGYARGAKVTLCVSSSD